MKLLAFSLAITLSSCIIGKSGVSYEEMVEPPEITVNDYLLEIKIHSSYYNSAKFIYDLFIDVDHENGRIDISALQAVSSRSNMLDYKFNLRHYGVYDLSQYSFFWINPDGQSLRLEVNETTANDE